MKQSDSKPPLNGFRRQAGLRPRRRLRMTLFLAWLGLAWIPVPTNAQAQVSAPDALPTLVKPNPDGSVRLIFWLGSGLLSLGLSGGLLALFLNLRRRRRQQQEEHDRFHHQLAMQRDLQFQLEIEIPGLSLSVIPASAGIQ